MSASDQKDNKEAKEIKAGMTIIRVRTEDADRIVKEIRHIAEKKDDRLAQSLTSLQKRVIDRSHELGMNAIITSQENIAEKLIGMVNVKDTLGVVMLRASQILAEILDREILKIKDDIITVLKSDKPKNEKIQEIYINITEADEISNTIWLANIFAGIIAVKHMNMNLPAGLRPPLQNSELGFDIVNQESNKKKGFW